MNTYYAIVATAGLFALFVLASIVMGHAQTTCQQIGQFRYCDGPNGSSSTSQQIGQFNYQSGTIRDSDGNSQQFSRTCQRIGQFTYCN